MPKVYKGVEQYPLAGVSMRYTFDAKPDAPTQKHRQYYAMLGTRGIWEDGWVAAAVEITSFAQRWCGLIVSRFRTLRIPTAHNRILEAKEE
jgi:arylsulfatase A-like enzyme